MGKSSVIELTLPFPPSVNRLWRAKRGGGVYRSPEYVTWAKAAAWEIAAQIKTRSIFGHYSLTIEAVKPDKRRRDLGNLEKAISDALVSAGVVEDDHLCNEIILRWVETGPPIKITLRGTDGGKEK